MSKPKYTDADGAAILSKLGFARQRWQKKIHALDEDAKYQLAEYLKYLYGSKELREISLQDGEPITALLDGGPKSSLELPGATTPPDNAEGPAAVNGKKRKLVSTQPSTKRARVGTALGDLVGNWNAEAQERDLESLEKLQNTLSTHSKAKQTAHQDSVTVHGMICALANGAYETYYLSFLGLILRLCPESELPQIIRQRLGAILDAWHVLGLDGENRIYQSFPARGSREEQVHCVKQWFGLISSFEESVEACHTIRHPVLRQDKLIALHWDEAHDDELLQYFHNFFFKDGTPSTKTQEFRQLLQQERISYHFDRLWLQDLLSKLLQASLEASNASDKLLASFLRSLSDSLGNDSAHGCENSNEVMARFLDRMRSKIKSLTEQNVHYQAEIARVQTLHANTLSELAITMEMDGVFGSISAVEQQKGEAELFKPHDPGSGVSEADRLLALTTALPERLSHQIGELKDKLGECGKALEIERQKTRQVLKDLDAAKVQSQADIRQLQEANQQSLGKCKEENKILAQQNAQAWALGEENQQHLADEQGKRHECERRLKSVQTEVIDRLSRLCQKLGVDHPSQNETTDWAADLWDAVEKGIGLRNAEMKEAIEGGEQKADALISHLVAQFEGRALFLGWNTGITHESLKRLLHEAPKDLESDIHRFTESLEYRERQSKSHVDGLRQKNEALIQELATTKQYLQSEQQRWDKEMEYLRSRNVELAKERNIANDERAKSIWSAQDPHGVTPSESARIAMVELLLSQIDHKAAPPQFAKMRDWESKAQVGGSDVVRWLLRFHPDKLVNMDNSIKGSYSEISPFGNALGDEIKQQRPGRDWSVGNDNFRPYQLILSRIDRMQSALRDAQTENSRLNLEYEDARTSLVSKKQTLREAQESIRALQISKEELQNRVRETATTSDSSKSKLAGLRELLGQYEHESHESLYSCYKNILVQHEQQRRLMLKLWNQCFDQVSQCVESAAVRNPQYKTLRGELADLQNVNIGELEGSLDGLESVWRRAQGSFTSDSVYDVLILLANGRTQEVHNTADIQRLLISADLMCLTVIDLFTAIIPDNAFVQDLKSSLVQSGAPQKTACFERFEPIFCRLINSLETPPAYGALSCEAMTSESYLSHHMTTLEGEKLLMLLNSKRVMDESRGPRPMSWPTMKPLQQLSSPPERQRCVEVEGSSWQITGIAMARKSIVVSLNDSLTGESGRIRLLTLLSTGDPVTANSNAEALFEFFISADCSKIAPLHPAINFSRCEGLVSKSNGTSATISLRDGGQKNFPASTVLRWGIHAAHALGDLYERQFRDRHTKGVEWVSHQKKC